MKAKIKLALGAAFAAIAVMAVPDTLNQLPVISKANGPSCYSEKEIDLLMRAHGWSKDEAKTILDLACKFSGRPTQLK